MKAAVKSHTKSTCNFLSKRNVSLRTTLVSVNVIFKMILRFLNYCVV